MLSVVDKLNPIKAFCAQGPCRICHWCWGTEERRHSQANQLWGGKLKEEKRKRSMFLPNRQRGEKEMCLEEWMETKYTASHLSVLCVCVRERVKEWVTSLLSHAYTSYHRDTNTCRLQCTFPLNNKCHKIHMIKMYQRHVLNHNIEAFWLTLHHI